MLLTSGGDLKLSQGTLNRCILLVTKPFTWCYFWVIILWSQNYRTNSTGSQLTEEHLHPSKKPKWTDASFGLSRWLNICKRHKKDHSLQQLSSGQTDLEWTTTFINPLDEKYVLAAGWRGGGGGGISFSESLLPQIFQLCKHFKLRPACS